MASRPARLSHLLLSLLSALSPDEKAACAATPASQALVFKARIWDVNQKSLYLQNKELVAGHLQGPNSALEEKIYWAHNRAFAHEKFPIILSVQDGRWCLACSSEGPPVLQLESVNITDLLKDSRETSSSSSSSSSSARFTFFRSYKEGLWRFESAAHPGWLLCTSSGPNEPLGLTQAPGPSHVVDFYFQPC